MAFCTCNGRYTCPTCIIEQYKSEALKEFKRVCSLPQEFAFHQLVYGEVGSYRLFLWLNRNDNVSYLVAINGGELTVLECPSPSVAFDAIDSVVYGDEARLRKSLEDPSGDLPAQLAAVLNKRLDFAEFAARVDRYLSRAAGYGALKVHDRDLYNYFRSLVAMALVVS
jgi:hypothetical protein